MAVVCSGCVGEPNLSAWIKKGESCAVCDFCRTHYREVVCLEDLAEWVHAALSEHFFKTSSEPEGMDVQLAKEGQWEQPGFPVDVVIADIAQVSDELAEAIRENLSDQYDDHGSEGMLDIQPYGCDTHYDERPIDTSEFEDSWQIFREEILTHARFFNLSAKQRLDSLFANVETFTTWHGSVVRTLKPGDRIYRGRLTAKMADAVEIIKGVPTSLGAPPPDYARAGRMNAEGIPVFYGALSQSTCIAELRPPVGSSVVIGIFEPVRELRVLDLTHLRKAYKANNYFDRNEQQSASRLAFLGQLERELTIPVEPGSEARNYLPTQVVSEYIASAEGLNLDGFMFTSSQVAPAMEEHQWPPAPDEPNKNIVLFAHASILEQNELKYPNRVRVECHEHSPPYDGEYDIEIIEGTHDLSFSSYDTAEEKFATDKPIQSGVGTSNLPSLSLDLESISVQTVESVKFQTSKREHYRHRYEHL